MGYITTRKSFSFFEDILSQGSLPRTMCCFSGHYLLAEGSGRYTYDVARLDSPTVNVRGFMCLRFYYHMYGDDVEELRVCFCAVGIL